MKARRIFFLVVAGFFLTYLEGLGIEYLNKTYLPDCWYPNQAIYWTVIFGIVHSILLRDVLRVLRKL